MCGRRCERYGRPMVKKLFWLLVIAGLGYGVYWYLNKDTQPGQP